MIFHNLRKNKLNTGKSQLENIISKIAARIDHTALKPDTGKDDVRRLCLEAVEHGFASVCILPIYVKLAAELLQKTNVHVCTVVGFPLGATFLSAKSYEADVAILSGADEIDMVMNIAALKNSDYESVQCDIEGIVNLAHRHNANVKVIIEACLLTNDEKIRACELITAAGADYIKTSTGFSSGGATIEDVKLIRKYAGEEIRIKAAGGIRNAKTALEMIEAGADRIGTSSGLAIIREALDLF